MTEEKWVRVMFDYSSSGIWEKSGCMMDDEDLPVTLELRERISKWVRLYDSHAWEAQSLSQNLEDEIDFSDETFTRLDELTKLCEDDFNEGVKIAIEIKSQLPDWTVKIFNHGMVDLPEDNHYNSEILADFRL